MKQYLSPDVMIVAVTRKQQICVDSIKGNFSDGFGQDGEAGGSINEGEIIDGGSF